MDFLVKSLTSLYMFHICLACLLLSSSGLAIQFPGLPTALRVKKKEWANERNLHQQLFIRQALSNFPSKTRDAGNVLEVTNNQQAGETERSSKTFKYKNSEHEPTSASWNSLAFNSEQKRRFLENSGTNFLLGFPTNYVKNETKLNTHALLYYAASSAENATGAGRKKDSGRNHRNVKNKIRAVLQALKTHEQQPLCSLKNDSLSSANRRERIERKRKKSPKQHYLLPVSSRSRKHLHIPSLRTGNPLLILFNHTASTNWPSGNNPLISSVIHFWKFQPTHPSREYMASNGGTMGRKKPSEFQLQVWHSTIRWKHYPLQKGVLSSRLPPTLSTKIDAENGVGIVYRHSSQNRQNPISLTMHGKGVDSISSTGSPVPYYHVSRDLLIHKNHQQAIRNLPEYHFQNKRNFKQQTSKLGAQVCGACITKSNNLQSSTTPVTNDSAWIHTKFNPLYFAAKLSMNLAKSSAFYNRFESASEQMDKTKQDRAVRIRDIKRGYSFDLRTQDGEDSSESYSFRRGLPSASPLVSPRFDLPMTHPLASTSSTFISSSFLSPSLPSSSATSSALSLSSQEEDDFMTSKTRFPVIIGTENTLQRHKRFSRESSTTSETTSIAPPSSSYSFSSANSLAPTIFYPAALNTTSSLPTSASAPTVLHSSVPSASQRFRTPKLFSPAEVAESSSLATPVEPVIRLGVILDFKEHMSWVMNETLPSIHLAVERVKSQKNLLSGYTFQIIHRIYPCSEAHGVLAGMDLYFKQSVHVFIGPTCDYSVAPLAKFSPYWGKGIPIVTPGGMVMDLGKKKDRYKFLLRMQGSYVNVAGFVHYFTRQFSWSTVGLVYHDFELSSLRSDNYFTIQPIYMAFQTNVSKPWFLNFDEHQATNQTYLDILKEISQNVRSKY